MMGWRKKPHMYYVESEVRCRRTECCASQLLISAEGQLTAREVLCRDVLAAEFPVFEVTNAMHVFDLQALPKLRLSEVREMGYPVLVGEPLRRLAQTIGACPVMASGRSTSGSRDTARSSPKREFAEDPSSRWVHLRA